MEATTAERRLNIVVDPQLISIPKVGTRQHYCLSANTQETNIHLIYDPYSSESEFYIARQVNN